MAFTAANSPTAQQPFGPLNQQDKLLGPVLFSSPEKSAVCLILDQPSRRNFYRHSNSVLTELSRGLEAACSHHSTLSLDSPPPLSAIRATSIYSIVSSERVETEQLSPLRSLCCGMRTLFPTTSELVRQMPSQTIKSRKEPPSQQKTSR